MISRKRQPRRIPPPRSPHCRAHYHLWCPGFDLDRRRTLWASGLRSRTTHRRNWHSLRPGSASSRHFSAGGWPRTALDRDRHCFRNFWRRCRRVSFCQIPLWRAADRFPDLPRGLHHLVRRSVPRLLYSGPAGHARRSHGRSALRMKLEPTGITALEMASSNARRAPTFSPRRVR